ncbi:hypothetical protein [Desulfitobacterium chlororespirans]|uniref:Uncharacterized protein n=1 Tax=Desulfitobacterium chlororespirans DSM 11544 TaxID=1121395 RepID=A0A1M7TQD0_9FIRM|nr:hypothetical protein [Desulfitobacterium chlororespirans]SHN72954.1 hypothetical protein SAMN02745215_02382 [Desulfitobacterium chlororespirans DSM 11544]
MNTKSARKRTLLLFEKHFKTKANNISIENDCDFYFQLMKAIKEEYKNQIDHNRYENFIIMEQILLASKLKFLQETKVNLNFFPIYITILLNCLIFTFTLIFSGLNLYLGKAIDRNLEALNVNFLFDLSNDFVSLCTNIAFVLIISTGLFFIAYVILQKRIKRRHAIEYSFNQICLKIISSIYK